ncbi:hypothetical protein NMU03_14510 [Allocoprobacillus halotolerans]|uniref:Uncharacterized protein n=1 Tax=Allocoprobacillus halotolerans TaxID=2944914 RepID=A0ABY5I3N6_9FIRM|nr:hypothetical protein [Allocoprobacillus halotolerans]UTY38791.1 hypothetical protein NMU03_14510 [Allocoprobacillus halotolerans]
MIENKEWMDISEKLVIKGNFYDQNHLPSQISNAIYQFGNRDIFEIIAFIDASDEEDGSKGMIITPQAIYFQFGQAGCIRYDEVTSLSLQKHHHDPLVKTVIRTKSGNYALSNKTINPEVLVLLLSEITGLNIEMIMTTHEKVAYYVPIILQDLQDDAYEDIELTEKQLTLIKEFNQELEIIEDLDEENYCYELEKIYPRVMTFFDELGLDSEEIDELYKIQEAFEQSDNIAEQKIEDAKRFYDDMMNQYSQGNTQMYDQVQSMMSQLGINESDLAGKSMDEIEDLLCERLGISKSVMDKLVKKFANKS